MPERGRSSPETAIQADDSCCEGQRERADGTVEPIANIPQPFHSSDILPISVLPALRCRVACELHVLP